MRRWAQCEAGLDEEGDGDGLSMVHREMQLSKLSTFCQARIVPRVFLGRNSKARFRNPKMTRRPCSNV